MIEEYGEKYRTIITDSLAWIEMREPLWGLEKPIDYNKFIEYLLEAHNHEA